MKAIGRLKITQLSTAEWGKRELNRLVGGERCCLCGCHYEDNGGSSTSDNKGANNSGGASGLYSPGGGTSGNATGSFT